MHADRLWLTDAGLETDLIFHGGFDLPLFASFHLLESAAGRDALSAYFQRFIDMARAGRTGLVLDTATWRSGAHWGAQLGRSPAAMDQVSRDAVAYARGVRDRHETGQTPILVNGVIGPAGDGYAPEALLTPDEAQRLHERQAQVLADAGADMISAVTITHTGEGIGITRAAAATGLPVVVSYTVETDGHLPTGQTLGEAIRETDAATGGAPAYYMINCAHPDHFADRIAGDWVSRIGGIRANASRLSHAELDASEVLDEGNPEEFGYLYGALAALLPNLRVIGGCCGTDHRHVGCAARHLLPNTPNTNAA
ncbi:homocysteine S-methyltransferase family protein [Actibacterium ureilyticum]|uniref:homocysteine S-methyltransferase family protein n=1 Tax=Actibacterium ureilyticum TaxID=1590614 RepID=UPI000BAAEF45|nr:homocysteine S-methyltransferase family protein [Actibacterium ureilyticum]